MTNGSFSELTRSDYTEFIYDTTCFGEPIDPESPDNVISGINRAIELEAQPMFLEGLSERLCELGVSCTINDTDTMLAEVKRRYNDILKKVCPRTVIEWIKGTTPGVTNRQNNYELCYALEMDFKQTAVFFQKHFLTLPFNAKSKVDAVFMYCLYHNKPYDAVRKMLDESKCFVSQENAHTSTSQIISRIFEIDNDKEFIGYLEDHCYDNEQQFQLARKHIFDEVNILQEYLKKYESEQILSTKRLNSLTLEKLLGFSYQKTDKKLKNSSLPKHFTQSLPDDTSFGKILNGDIASYDLLRKTLMLLKFYNFYCYADNDEPDNVYSNLMDFYSELNSVLFSCGFAQLYVRHPFDCLLIYCTNSSDPIDTLYCVIENGRN